MGLCASRRLARVATTNTTHAASAPWKVENRAFAGAPIERDRASDPPLEGRLGDRSAREHANRPVDRDLRVAVLPIPGCPRPIAPGITSFILFFPGSYTIRGDSRLGRNRASSAIGAAFHGLPPRNPSVDGTSPDREAADSYLKGVLVEPNEPEEAARAFRRAIDVAGDRQWLRDAVSRVDAGEEPPSGHGVLHVILWVGRGPILEEIVETPTTLAVRIAGIAVSSLDATPSGFVLDRAYEPVSVASVARSERSIRPIGLETESRACLSPRASMSFAAQTARDTAFVWRAAGAREHSSFSRAVIVPRRRSSSTNCQRKRFIHSNLQIHRPGSACDTTRPRRRIESMDFARSSRGAAAEPATPDARRRTAGPRKALPGIPMRWTRAIAIRIRAAFPNESFGPRSCRKRRREERPHRANPRGRSRGRRRRGEHLGLAPGGARSPNQRWWI
jgi:hypothetical protein